MSDYVKRLPMMLDKLYNLSFVEESAIDEIRYINTGYKKDDKIPALSGCAVYDNTVGWGGVADSHFWFVFEVDVPENFNDYVLSVKTGYNIWHASNPQFIVYLNGEIAQGLDENHTEATFNQPGRQLVGLYAYTGSETRESISLSVKVCKVNRQVRRLFYALYSLSEVISYSDEKSREYKVNLKHINNAYCMLDISKPHSESFNKSVAAALDYLRENALRENKHSPTVYCVGQTHIDVAWLWTLEQTREKVQRSFSGVLRLMEKYPEFTFMASTPVLYEYIKETQPQLFAKIKELIKEGRWEVEGAMLVESDNILPSGESLIRQILYGKKYFKDEFDKDCRILWLPDCFGFSASMPQIALKCGIEWFVSSKISWNDTNRFPYDIFDWQGIDGSVIKTYFLTTQKKLRSGSELTTVYNGMASAAQIAGTYERLTEKELTEIVLLTYGWGDGGGGPTESMLETLNFLKGGVEGCPKVKISSLGEFFADLEKQIGDSKLPKWIGELYLEFHRGIYTSVAKNKRNNRKAEALFQQAEMLCAINGEHGYKLVLESLWKTLLIHQFHDVLPGSSVKQVYDRTDEDYSQITESLEEIINEQTQRVIENGELSGDVVVFNYNSFRQSGIIDVGGELYEVFDIAPKGYSVISLQKSHCSVYIEGRVLENKFYRIVFDKNYEITEFFDKRVNRNIVKDKGLFNALKVYDDINYEYDAWELKQYHSEKSYSVHEVCGVEVYANNISAGLIITKKFRESTITQKVILYNSFDTVDFDTEIDWKEKNVLLKAEFDANINCDKALYNIQFGNIERSTTQNTSWEKAKFEVPFHKFFDLSECGYGLSILNDCKYGGSATDKKMTLSLIKSPTYPYEEADKCKHKFIYSLVGHVDSVEESGIIQKAFGLNMPLRSIKLGGEHKAKEYSFSVCEQENIVIETIKPSEDGKAIVMRIYDMYNKKSDAKFRLAKRAAKIFECDMLENIQKCIAQNTDNFTIKVSNYEIKTVMVAFDD